MSEKELKSEIKTLKNTVERLVAEIPLIALRNSGNSNTKDLISKMSEDVKQLGQNNAQDGYSKYALRDVADIIRKDFFRKTDKTPHIVGTIMGVIAIIAAMTSIIQPMNTSISNIKTEVKEVEERLMSRILTLEEGEKDDKKSNTIVEMMYKQQEAEKKIKNN